MPSIRLKILRVNSAPSSTTIQRKNCRVFLRKKSRNSSKKSSPLHTACKKGDLEQVRKLIQKENVDPMKPDQTGMFPIHIAIMENKIDCVKMLLNQFACSPNVVDKNRMTGLHYACLFGYVDIVRLLVVHHDIDLISRNLDGKSCIDICENVNSSSTNCVRK